MPPVLLLVSCLSILSCVYAQTCGVVMPYTNMQYLSSSQLTLYNLTNPCTTACTSGYYGDFCAVLPPPVPQGPWNQAGYYVAGQALLRSLTLDASQMSQTQFVADSLVALTSPMSITGKLVMVSLSARTVTPILSAPAAGSLDALVVRRGVVYVSRSLSPRGPYEIVTVTPSVNPTVQRLMNVSYQAVGLEVFVDKGTVTVFITDANQVTACYPGGKCAALGGKYPGITGLFCGLECPSALYFTQMKSLYKLANAQGSVLVSPVLTDASSIYCLAGDRSLNTLIYLSGAGLRQVNLATNQSLPLAPGLQGVQFCSVDISDSYSQVLVVQSGTISTLDAFQRACGYSQTSPAVYSNASTMCTPCPSLPDNAFLLQGSATCEWQCNAGYSQSGSLCSLLVAQPCPSYFRMSSSGLCLPSVQPWAPASMYASSVSLAPARQWPSYSTNPYLLASDGTAVIMAVSGGLYYAPNGSYAWSKLTLVPGSTGGVCAQSTNNAYNLLTLQGGVLWAAFTAPVSPQSAHCLWALSATSKVATMVQSWMLGGQICAVAGGQNLTAVYVIFCRTHYISQLSRASVASPLAGGSVPGYSDGGLLAAAFNSPSAMLLYLSRLFVADTGNCVLREIDLTRGSVSTVAGAQGICQRSDGTRGGLAYPTNLTYSAFPGFFLFLDRYPTEAYPAVRQFHAPTGTVQTIVTSPVTLDWLTYLLGFQDRILVGRSNQYAQVAAAALPCPASYTASAGGAFSASDCTACAYGYYSSGAGCLACSAPVCSRPGQVLTPCQGGQDAYCSTCTNKPAGSTQYTGPSTVPANSTGGGGDCPWSYVPPCPVGYYQNGTLCLACPLWSTTKYAGATSIAQCVCVANGAGANGACVIPSPLAAMPLVCGALAHCTPYAEPPLPFALLNSCAYGIVDSPQQVCSCSPGEYLQQVYPKVCLTCPAGLYSPQGRGCQNCPFFMAPTQDQTACRCAAGAWDSAPSTSSPVCMCGAGMRLAGGCTPCPENTYSTDILSAVEGAASECAACPAGKVAVSGSSECVDCAQGQYREDSDAWCTSCDTGFYAPDPTSSTCVACVGDCGGLKESQCPTDSSLVACSECDAPRANASFSGGLDCATECLAGFYELEGACTPCDVFDSESCPAGSVYVPCSAYKDSGCVPCTNASKPLNYAEWGFSPAWPGGPSAGCDWKCISGYEALSKPLAGGVVWECFAAQAWSVWELFTV